MGLLDLHHLAMSQSYITQSHHISDLPVEILGKIFSYNDSIQSVSLVCRQFHDACEYVPCGMCHTKPGKATCRECPSLMWLCSDCAVAACAGVYCAEHCPKCPDRRYNDDNLSCKYCHRTFCEECGVKCELCNKLVCQHRKITCEQCDRLACEDCGCECALKICKKWLCYGCGWECRCKNSICNHCRYVSRCWKCRVILCNNCGDKCESCAEYVCENCSCGCDICDRVMCEQMFRGV